MPISPYAKLRVSVNGGAPQTGGVVAPASATLQFSFESTVGWTKYRLAVVGPPSWTLPAGWTNESGTYVYTGVDTPPGVFTLPAISVWGKYMPTLTVNDGLRFAAFDPAMIDTSTAISMLSTSGLEDIGLLETNQFYGLRGWIGALQAALRKVEAALVITGLTLSNAVASALGTAAAGAATDASRSDHVHNHGNQLGGALHAIATSIANGFMSAADKVILDAIVSATLARNVPTSAGTAVANVDTKIYDVPASPTGSFRALVAAVVGRMKTGLTGSGTVTVTVGTTSGGNDLQLAKAVVTATSVGTDFGVAAAELGTAFTAANTYNTFFAAGGQIWVRMATSGTVTVAPTFEWTVFGVLMGT